jgi:Ca2+-binding RTX toxin-like protein
VACVGAGTQHWVQEVEIFDPASETWTPMAHMATPRMYHSSTMLLPDGRVVSSGGGQGSGGIHNYATIEIFSPPYLFKGARPSVTSSPAAVGYAQSFDLGTPDASDIAKASLIRLGVTTHGNDQNARFVPLTFQAQAGAVEITGARVGGVDVPISPNIAPPGYYMVFLVNNAGVPSIGRYIRVGDGPLAQCQNQTVNTDPGTCAAANVSVDAGSFDPGGSAVSLTQAPPPPYGLGTTEVVLTATDGSGLSDTCHATVTVEDHEPPAFSSVPADITTTLCGSFDIGAATAQDACAGTVSVTNDAPAQFSPGTTLVTWTAQDAQGNVATATQRVTVILTDNPACCPAGSNVIVGNSNSNTLNGTAGSDCILGLGAQDTINGMGGNDFISGGDGNDVIDAGPDDDVVFAGSGQDTVNGSSGNDSLHGGDGDDTLLGGSGDDSLSGGQGQDSLQGQDGNDRLLGDDGDDNLQGGAGNDDLVGGVNNDTCNGGSGSNTFAQCEFGAPSSCTDGVGNGTETDVDCGGACPDCAVGSACVSGSDCAGGSFCIGGSCQAPAGSTPNLIQTELSFSTDWGGGYCAVLNVTSSATAPTTTFTVTLDTNQSTIFTSWNANFSSASGTVSVIPGAGNSVIEPGETDSSIGFCANRTTPGSGTLPLVVSTTASF